MAEKIPDNITAKEFFEKLVPKQLATMEKVKGMEGTQLSVQFNITGDGGGTWTLVVTDGDGKNAKVKTEADDKAQITITMDVKDWRDSVTGKIQGLDIMQQTGRGSRAQFDKLKTVSGTLRLELTKNDGSLLPMELMFNKGAAPKTTLKAKASDYADIQSGKLNGQQAFMSGKIKISGDMGFAMKIGTMMM